MITTDLDRKKKVSYLLSLLGNHRLLPREGDKAQFAPAVVLHLVQKARARPKPAAAANRKLVNQAVSGDDLESRTRVDPISKYAASRQHLVIFLFCRIK
jgi:hypothetical protein